MSGRGVASGINEEQQDEAKNSLGPFLIYEVGSDPINRLRFTER